MLKRRRKNNPSIYENSAELVERVLREGADPNFIRESENYFNRSALSYAVCKRYSEVIDIFKVFLNDSRTDVNKVGIDGLTPLMNICRNYVSEEVAVELISLLLKHSQIEVNNSKNVRASTALYYACINGRSKCVKALIEDDRTDINITNNYDRTTPLYEAVDNGDLETVKVLLTSPSIDPNIILSGKTSLHLAHLKGYKEIMIELLKHNRTNPNILDEYMWTPLYFAVNRSQLEIVKVLLSCSSIDPNILSRGQTPLHKAHEEGDKEIMKELLKDNRTRTDIPDSNGKTFIDLETDKEILELAGVVEYYEDFLCM